MCETFYNKRAGSSKKKLKKKKKKKVEAETYIIKRGFKEKSSNCNIWSLSESWFKQTILKNLLRMIIFSDIK